MKISTKGRYALRMMIDTAQNQDRGFVALKDIAERQDISKKYLEQIVLQLTQAGMLRASRGHQGGYMLTEPPEKYTVGAILRAVEGPLSPVACLDQQPNQCERCDFCLTLPVWEGLQAVVERYLDGITLKDVIEGNVPREG
ncbi:MAG: Rrf2 family transcriptional regulator [Clostridia bacterium]|nr:Rrf2 family transcriptional regulator [Clostridia bacterium]